MQSLLPLGPREGGGYFPAISALVRLLVAVSFLLASVGDMAEAKASQPSHSLAGLAGLVAICGDGGIRYIRIDGFDSEVPASDDCSCTACLCCVTGCAGLAGPYPPGTSIEVFASHSRQFIAFTPDALPVAAEQYWAASRGPPDPKEEKSMTTMHVRNAAPMACFAVSGGHSSCF